MQREFRVPIFVLHPTKFVYSNVGGDYVTFSYKSGMALIEGIRCDFNHVVRLQDPLPRLLRAITIVQARRRNHPLYRVIARPRVHCDGIRVAMVTSLGDKP